MQCTCSEFVGGKSCERYEDVTVDSNPVLILLQLVGPELPSLGAQLPIDQQLPSSSLPLSHSIGC